MANTVEILPKADYTVAVVGPSKNWGFDGNDGARVEMATDSIQFAGQEQYWVDVNRSAKASAPAVGEVLNGTITQDEAGKYPPKFNKTKAAGGGRGGFGGGQSSPGAIWSAALETSAHIVAGYFAASGSKPKSISDYLSKVEQLAPKVNAIVDKLVGAAKPAPAASANTDSESGESSAPAAAAPAPAPAAQTSNATAKDEKTRAQDNVTIEDISDDELGDW